MMKTLILAATAAASVSLAGAALAEDFPATPMNSGPPTMMPMMPMMQPMMAPAAEPAMDKPMMHKKMHKKMMKKKMMAQ